ncbi:MAG: hypothetical protein A2Z34_06860 [Planctomycetes bacterium RBG_16_59_8]|nr:MAG: hypothetical protein A2Z34_06860 [Planctomycetes bacterium RBG_16_59_8]
MAKKELYTTGEVAKICKVALRTVQLYCERGVLEARKSPVTGHRRILRPSLLQFMRKHGIPAAKLNEMERSLIFIADDDPRFVKILTSAIALRIPGCDVASAGDGYTALIDISSAKPDVVVIDIRMPKVDGIELCRKLKTNARTRRIKLVAVTAYAGEGYESRVTEAGAMKCFTKPLNMVEFTEYLKKIL